MMKGDISKAQLASFVAIVVGTIATAAVIGLWLVIFRS